MKISDEEYRKSLRDFFKSHGVGNDAQEWLLMLWDSIQFIDDIYDKENNIESNKLSYSLIYKSSSDLLIKMPSNSFFAANCTALLPIMASSFLKWKAANDREELGKADAKSFVWRAGYYDVLLQAIMLCRGFDYAMENSNEILGFYGESFDEYLKEYGVKDA